MKKVLFYLKHNVCALSLVVATASVSAQQPTANHAATPHNKGHQVYKMSKLYDNLQKAERVPDNAQDRSSFEFMRLADPSGKIPDGIRKAEVEFSSKIGTGDDSQKSLAIAAKSSKASTYSNWQNRGPYNVGGRTRALAIDRTNENVILAGGVSGGLWRSENGGESWTKVTRSFQDPSITDIIQDPRSSKSFTWYYVSGERYGNSASAGGAFYQGSGVYKSQDGGRTWELLNSTVNQTPGSFDSAFDLVNSIAIDPTNGDLYLGTLTGVLRSQDGGNSFTEVLPGGFDTKAEVAISSTGQIYATMDFGSTPAGFFTSTDGDTWTNITPADFGTDYGRTVIEIDPSNEDIVYFLTRDAAGSGVLSKYDASAATPEDTWTDLTANLPLSSIGGSVGNLNLQGEYNMVIEVSPADSNLMFVGGTNLYRSTTGFTTPAGQESWIAGYSPLNNVSVYTDQHPDQHVLIFYPSNPNKALSGNDGGVFVTEDITMTLDDIEPVDWTSLNNGYITTQPYHVSFDPEANSDDLVAGFQDNGTWFTSSTNTTDAWIEDFGGDGSYNAIADGGLTRYVSSQNGRVYRFNFNEAGEFQSFTRVQPAAASGFSFVAPFVLDPNNDNIMYMPAGNTMWRNRNLDEIPLFSNASTTVNWTDLSNGNTPVGTAILALDVSTYPVANRLYYGTSTGEIYKMDNANIDGQEGIDISTGKGLPAAFINDINVDPSDSDRVIVTFSNYGVISLFLTENGGDTWMNISGNLEQNADGSGNGPSVRSTAFFGGSQGVLGARLQRIYAATSTGLYYTTRLNGSNTVWRKENIVIGTAVTDEVKTRKDGFIAVASHGNGLYSAKFPLFNELPESELSVAYLLSDITLFQNSEETEAEIDITDLFVHSGGAPIDIEFSNSNPDFVTATLEGNTIKLVYNRLIIGDEATISLVATSGEETVAEGFTISVSEKAVYEQNDASITVMPSQLFTDFGGLAQTADDFTVAEGDTWTIERIVAFGVANNTPTFTSATVVIYQDNLGAPGEEVYNSGELAPISDATDTNLNLLLNEAAQLEEGTYWLSVYANLPFNPDATQWFWSSQNGGIGEEPFFRDNLNLFGTGAVDWTPASLSLGRPPIDQIFQVFGVISSESTDTSSAAFDEPLLVLDESKGISVGRNPSSSTFEVTIGDLDTDKALSMNVYNLLGERVFTQSDVEKRSTVIWDASNLVSGVYILQIDGANMQPFKLVKQ
ncbi:T9SS type A sorting domain-containing protein [Aquimarina pacifica]|uniref:T9SS type A sorting domain-containing protein n=1 Tax=Aquimarina pacifica TaxID=1296415 RepID=UPI0004718DCA|nr:T9SS type A sorting domain-containing protein [Aquimarina pacifica]